MVSALSDLYAWSPGTERTVNDVSTPFACVLWLVSGSLYYPCFSSQIGPLLVSDAILCVLAVWCLLSFTKVLPPPDMQIERYQDELRVELHCSMDTVSNPFA